MKKLLKDKRGIAMESAVMFMLVVFMFGLLLTGIAMTSHLQVKVNDTLLERELEIEQIGEYFVRMDAQTCTNYIESCKTTYEYDIDDNTLTLTRNNKVVLYVEVDRTNNNAIKVWKYTP